MPDTNAVAEARAVDTNSSLYSPVAEAAIADAASRCSNWGRWGDDDVLGTMNFLDDTKRVEGASRIRRGAALSLAQSFDANGPQHGWRKRNNPVHTMLVSGLDA